MSIILDLPMPIDEELTQDSQREGVSESEHVALLVCLASAFKQEEPHTPFQKAIEVFLSHHALDAKQVFSAFEELVHVCLEAHDAGKSEASFQKMTTAANFQNAALREWRNSIVHLPVDVSYDSLSSDTIPSDSLAQRQGRITTDSSPEKTESNSREQVHVLLAQWQAEDKTPLRLPIPTRQDETPTQALFRKWAEEDVRMTEEEKEAEDRLWEDIEKGMGENHLTFGLRRSAS